MLPNKHKGPTEPGSHLKKQEKAWLNHEAAAFRAPGKGPVSYNTVPPPMSYDASATSEHKNAFNESARNNRIQTGQARKDPGEDGPHDATSSGLIINPDNPDYNPAVFYNELLEKFVCPYKICK